MTRTDDAFGTPQVSTWFYDTATTDIGKLHTASSTAGYLVTQSYDTLGRPSSSGLR